jgi:ssDNA-binding Zn-finger/Zn-ribbon topoisomerase 1
MKLDKEKRDALKDNSQQYLFFLHFLTINYKDREFTGLLGLRFPEMYIKPVTNDLVQLFEDFDIPFFRIRACPVCGNIYWASKLNSETCGKKECVTTLGNRKRLKAKKK